MTQSQIHLGKNGVTDTFLNTLRGHFKNRDTVKISILKNASRDKKEIQKMTDKILDSLGKNYTARKLGFTLFVRKWRRDMRE